MSLRRHRSFHPVRWAGETARRLRRVFHDRSGTVAIIVAFSIIPLIGAVGIATDTARGYLVKSRLQAAVDSAALAGGRVFYDANRDSDIQQYFAANFPNGYMNATLTPLSITPDAANETINLSAQATIPTTFMRLMGSTSMTVSATAQVKRRTDRLHVVLAMDMSVSMNGSIGGQTRLEAAQAAAHTLVGILFGTNPANNLLKIGLVPYTGKVNVTYDGTRYGYDPDGSGGWTPHAGALYAAQAVTTYTNPYPSASTAYPYQSYSANANYLWKYASPYGGMTQSDVYIAHNSPVPLLTPPPTGWKGCVYARYLGADSTSADLKLGPTTSSGGEDWPGWQPMGMPRASTATMTVPYDVNAGDGFIPEDGSGHTLGTFGVAQASATSGQPVTASLNGTFSLPKGPTTVSMAKPSGWSGETWNTGDAIYWNECGTNKATKSTSCSSGWTWKSNTYLGTAAAYASSSDSMGSVSMAGENWAVGDVIYWNNDTKRASKLASGMRIGVAAAASVTSDATGSVTLDESNTGDARPGNNDNSNSSPNNVCLDTHANANSTSAGSRTADCADCPTVGITALESTRSVVDDAIDNLNIPGGAQYYTNIPDGLAWAWEVLMPTAPFTEGALPAGTAEPPRAIVLMTDGSNTCAVGDAYQNYSGCGVFGDNSWRNQRLIDLATAIKAQGVYIYAIQFADAGNAGLLQQVATKTTAPFYYYAPSAADLSNAFTEIANNLSNLRLSR